METIHKQFDFQVMEKTEDGGRIVISTATLDRDHDRVMSAGAKIDAYMRNPVVQWGHNYRDPWATIGRSKVIEVGQESLVAEFELRPPINESDPQNIIRQLWEGGWVRTASIGFRPLAAKPNDAGGMDFGEWELLEWSLVPVPANQEALRLAVKGLEEPPPPPVVASLKRGRVLSAKNEAAIREAVDAVRGAADRLDDVLSQLDKPEEDDKGQDEKGAIPPHTTPKADEDTECDGPAVVAELSNERAALRRVHAWGDDKRHQAQFEKEADIEEIMPDLTALTTTLDSFFR